MNFVEADVYTICVGTAASMASFVLAGGEKGKRIALPHARIMIHQPEGGGQGQASEVLSESEEVIRLRKQVGKIYSERTNQTLTRISKDMDRDQFMSAKEAKDYGIVDQVAIDVKWSSF
jgi:ATP-dependent Clp protease protease subunit